MTFEVNGVTVVSGLPRSGTSMAMRMLDAGGIPLYGDDIRQPDDSNPHGYFESEKVLKINVDSEFIGKINGKAIKIVSPLLKYLPSNNHYRVIFMRRDLSEIIMSQKIMLGRASKSPAAKDGILKMQFRRHLNEIERWIDESDNVEVIFVRYQDAINHPEEVAQRISSFLGEKLLISKMVCAVDPGLYRNVAGLEAGNSRVISNVHRPT